MTRTLVRRATRLDDEGFALATVLLVMALVTTLVMVTAGVVIASLRSGSDHDNFEGAIAAAEAGIDKTLSRLQANQSYSSGPSVGQTFASADAERQWAYTTIMGQVAAGTPYTDTGSGQFMAIKPADRNIIYSLGCDPTCTASNAKMRMLKVEYLFAPYKPGNAILTGGNLLLSSSVTTNVLVGGMANVHTNGSVDGTGASPTINGDVTASGSYALSSNGSVGAGSGGGQPLQTVPIVDPRFLYNEYSSTYGTNWYDLCPDGTVHSPSGIPCSGTQVATAATGTPFRGWTWTTGSGTVPPTWSMTSSVWGAGTYYVYQGDANISRNIVAGPITVIAESAPTGGSASTCLKLGGNISAQGVTISSSALPGTVLVAQAQLSITSNFSGGVGVFAAGDQVHIETSSNGITGTVIANDICTASGNVNEVKNAVIHYDQNVEIPLLDIIRTTQWLELQPNAN